VIRFPKILAALSIAVLQLFSVLTAHSQSKVEKVFRHAYSVATFDLTFPGAYGGYTLAHIPVKVVRGSDTVVERHAFLIDLTTLNSGVFQVPDSVEAVSTNYEPFEFVSDSTHIIHTELAQTKSKGEYRKLDSTFFGVLGHSFFKKFTTVFDFKKNQLILYPLYANMEFADRDTSIINTPYYDDAVLTYCSCPYSTIWLEADAAPLRNKRVHLAFAEPMSSIFPEAMDAKLLKKLENEAKEDTLTGQRPKVGVTLANFRINNVNIAPLQPKRNVQKMPPAFKDLNIKLLGTMGTDVLREFSALVIDPARTRILLVR